MYDFKQRYILKAALNLFKVYGLRAVTMDEMAQVAGMSKKTIYQYFKDKNDVIDSLYETIISIFRNRLSKIEAGTVNEVYRYIKMIELAMHARQYISNTTVEELKKFHPATHKKLQFFIDNSYVTAVKQCIERGIETGLFQPIFNSDLMAMLCLSELNFLNESGNKKLSALSSTEIKEQLTRHLINGIATTAGKKQIDKYFSNTKL